MIVTQSSVSLSSDRTAYAARQVTQSLRVESRMPARVANQPVAVGKTEAAADANGLSPELNLLKSIVERMVGHEIRLFHMGAQAQGAGAGATRSGGPAVEYERVERLQEGERTQFHGSGEVRLDDGRTIAFDVALVMERTFASESRVAVSTAPVNAKDPLMINLDGGAVRVSDVRFQFDLNADGVPEAVALPDGGSAFLAFDRNGNARIDSGTELFGPVTGQGFAELSALDSDGNGWVDSGDKAYAAFGLWKPDAAGAGTLTSLSEAGIGALQVNAIDTPFTLRNDANQTLGFVRSSAVYLTESGNAGVVQQVDLVA